MRYAVLGDIHGNYYALEAVLEDIKNEYGNKIDGYILTGDYMGEFPDGSKVVETLKKLTKDNPGKVHIIKGNRETGQVEPYLEKLKNSKEPDWDIDSTMGAALVTCRELGKENLEYLKELPLSRIISNGNMKPIFIKHRMPLEKEEIERVKNENMIVITAHTHEAHLETIDGITQFNPGSVGLPDEGIIGATYGIMESTGRDWKFGIRDVKYDYQKTIDSLRQNKDLYERCCGWGKALELSLGAGVNCTVLYAFEVKRLAVIVEEARKRGEEPDLSALSDLSDLKEFFSQNRYGNVAYDGTILSDNIIQTVDDVSVVGLANVVTVGNQQAKTPTPTKELYDIALENVKKVLAMLDLADEMGLPRREIVYEGRHGNVVSDDDKTRLI